MLKVELIFDSDCPNVPAARNQLTKALTKVGLSPQWQEWDRADTKSPAYTQNYASPSILVNGHDVAGGESLDGTSGCRVYTDEDGNFQGVPSLHLITRALVTANERKTSWRGFLAVLSALGAALLPTLSCPACWPAYAGLLSSLGVGFFNYTPYVFPLTALCLMMALFTFFYRAKCRHGYGPLALGTVAAILMLLARFVFMSNLVLYIGIGLLVCAALWNGWPRKWSLLSTSHNRCCR